MKTLALTACLASAVLACGALGCSSSSSNALSGDGGGTPATEGGSGTDASGDATASPEASAGKDGSADSDSGAAPEASTGDTGTGDMDSGAGNDTGSPQDSGAPVDCGSTPTLHLDPAGTIFCGYGSDGGKVDCLTGTQCCLGGELGGGLFAPEQCAARSAMCSTGGQVDAGGSLAIPIACMQIADCAANGVTGASACCLQGASSPSAVSCTYPKAQGGAAVVCETGGASPGTCAAGETQICSSQSDCPSGTTCTAGKWKLFQVGFCL
jgi:hypothetical protein